MPLSTRAIVTVAEAQAYLGGLSNWNTADTAYLDGGDVETNGWIDVCSNRIEEYTGNRFQPYDYEEVMDGSGCDIQQVVYYPVIQLFGDSDAAKLANLQYRDSYDSAWTDLVDDIDIIHYPKERPDVIQLLDGSAFPCGTKNLRIRWISGYAAIPSTVKLVCLEMLFTMWKESGKGIGRLGMSSQSSNSTGAGMTNAYIDMNERWKTLLAPYRKLVR